MTPLEKAWEAYGGRLMTSREGRNKACCPLHEDRNASATVNVSEGKWVCHAGCGYGDIYELIKLAENCDSFPECKRIAGERFGEDSSSTRTVKKKRPGRRKPQWVGE